MKNEIKLKSFKNLLVWQKSFDLRTIISKKSLYSIFYILNSRNSGQALVELLVGLTIGAIVIGITVSAAVVILKSNVQVKNFQIASAFGQELIDRTQIIVEAKWNDIYNLSPKGTSTNYFVIASGTSLAVIQGKEGVLGNDVRNGLIGNWKFDEATGTTAYDFTGGSKHGIFSGGVINRVAGKVSDAINFDGADDYINVSSTINYTSGQMTVAAWIKPSAVACPLDVIIDSKRGFVNGGFTLDLEGSNCAQVLWYLWFENGLLTLGVMSTAQLNSNQWYFIAGTYDAVTMKIYINGQLDNTQPGSGPMTDGGAATTQIGTRIATGNYFPGIIDDVRIYNRALSAEEVKRLYDSGIFTRFFNVENICRTNDSSFGIIAAAPCGGTDIDDPSTQKITSRTQWTAIDKTPEVKIATYLTRWRNFIFNQTDWSGGSGQNGPFTEPGNVFSTSTNTNATGTSGSLKIQGF